MVYDPIRFDRKNAFEPDFTERFNGLLIKLMIKGSEKVRTVHLAVFPTDEVLETFLDDARSGDLLFMHHPLFMECGDPRGWGRGFSANRIDKIAIAEGGGDSVTDMKTAEEKGLQAYITGKMHCHIDTTTAGGSFKI